MQYGTVTTAQFNVALSSSRGNNFGGRTVTETNGTPAQGSDNCSWSGAPWWNHGLGRMLTLASNDSWSVQNDGVSGSYGPDLVGLSADLAAYTQAYSPNVGSPGRALLPIRRSWLSTKKPHQEQRRMVPKIAAIIRFSSRLLPPQSACSGATQQ